MRLKLYAISVLALLFNGSYIAPVTAGQDHYKSGSILSKEIRLQDQSLTTLSLSQVLAELDKPVNLLYLFGGGGMGHESKKRTGGLWCPDSFEDMHILRSLTKNYEGRVGIIPIAIPAVFHTRKLGFGEGVMLNLLPDDPKYQAAQSAFIQSTQSSFEAGIIPIQPLYDLDFNLLISQEAQEQRKASSIRRQPWHGTFRAADETQSYGVPNLWLVDADGKVLREPFRGNVYYPHDEGISIRYSLQEVIAAIEESLNK